MLVRLDYGSDGLEVDLPQAPVTVIEPVFRQADPDPHGTLLAAMRAPIDSPPLRALARPGQKVAISVCDITRAQPRRDMLRAIFEEIPDIPLTDITILIATGTHRINTDAELERMLGRDILDRCRVINHDSRDDTSLERIGTIATGVDVRLNREWLAADVRITTGFVEPHFFAGFSGGPKLVAPGLAGLETVLTLHDARRIGDPQATWGIVEGNPVHDDIRAVVAAVGEVDFGLDVVLNKEQRIVEAFGGSLPEMHAAAREASRRLAMQRVPALYDVVVTTNAGYPLDQNLYQAVKGMSAAYQVAKPGGTIVCAAECRDGFPDHGSYREVLASADSPSALFAEISARTATVPDQWQVQIQARIQADCRVVMHTSYLSDAELATAHLQQTADVSATVAEALAAAGPDARLCVLPEGPQTIPYVEGG